MHTSRRSLTYSNAKSNVNKQNIYINWTVNPVTLKIQYNYPHFIEGLRVGIGSKLIRREKKNKEMTTRTQQFYISI